MIRKTNSRKRGNRSSGLKVFGLFAVLLAFLFVLLSSTLGGRFGPFHQLGLEVLGPGQRFFVEIGDSFRVIYGDYVQLWGVRDENKQLRQTVSELQSQLDEYREAYSLNQYLIHELAFKKEEKFPSLSAKVIGRDPSFWFQTLIVDRGESDGVVKGMVARTSRGVAGQVIQVSKRYSKILLANAPSSAIDAMIQKTRVRGILKGAGEKGFVLKYVLKNADVKEGDLVVTAGIGGIFPSGIPLGNVSSVKSNRRGMFQELYVEPRVDFQKLEFLFINLSEKQSLQDDGVVDEN